MNKKGHLGTILLVFGALILVITALMSFSNFGNESNYRRDRLRGLSFNNENMEKSIFKEIDLIVKQSIDFAKFSSDFENDFKISFAKLAEQERGSDKFASNNVFVKIANSDYASSNNGKNYTILMKDLFYITESADKLNKITNSFSLKIVFDKEKVISIE